MYQIHWWATQGKGAFKGGRGTGSFTMEAAQQILKSIKASPTREDWMLGIKYRIEPVI